MTKTVSWRPHLKSPLTKPHVKRAPKYSNALLHQLRDTRIKRGLSLRALAETIGSDPTDIYRWEHALNQPHLGNALAWLEALDFTITPPA